MSDPCGAAAFASAQSGRTVDLRSVTTTGHLDADVHQVKPVLADNQDRLLKLVAQELGLDQIKRDTVDLPSNTCASA